MTLNYLTKKFRTNNNRHFEKNCLPSDEEIANSVIRKLIKFIP
jgi:hypothetical protein